MNIWYYIHVLEENIINWEGERGVIAISLLMQEMGI